LPVSWLLSAVGEREGVISLGIDESTECRSSSTIDTGDFTKVEVVNQTTLEASIERFGIPDFVKVDIEGVEELVFYNRAVIDIIPKTIFIVEVRNESKEAIFSVFIQS
jgi:FkbM family methyltransferase